MTMSIRALGWPGRTAAPWFALGGGIYHTDGQLDDQDLPISNIVQAYSFSSANPLFAGLSYPLAPYLAYAEAGGLGVVSPRDLDRNRKDDYVSAWTAAIQQKLPFNLVGTMTYLGNKGTDVLTTTYVNLAVPRRKTLCLIPPLALSPGAATWATVHSKGCKAMFDESFSNGFLLSANYMWSHSINDGSIGGGESDTPQDSFCRACDKASSDDDIRQTFNLSAVYSLPFKNRIWGNWEVSAIGTAQTGFPVNITVDRSNSAVPGLFSISGEERPNYVNGVPLTPSGGPHRMTGSIRPHSRCQPIRPSATWAATPFGLLAFRNSIWDFQNSFTSLRNLNLRFRADLFNVFNRAQFGAPNADISASNFGTITSTISNYATGRGTPRELQLSAKIVF